MATVRLLPFQEGELARVDQRDSYGQTALHYAAEAGQRDIVTQLVRHGADTAAVDKDGKSVREMAADPETRALLDTQ